VAVKFLSGIDFAKSEAQNMRMQNLGTAPTTPALGQMYFDTAGSVNLFRYWNGTAWIAAPRLDQIPVPTAAVALNSQQITGLADPSGAQHAATQNYVLGRKVTDLAAPTASFSMNSQKITNVATPTTGGDAAEYTWTLAQVESARQGISYKHPVRVAATTSITVASPGATINAVTMAASDRVLLTAQSTGSENGIYVWNGAATPMTRATDADVFSEVQDGTQVYVREGTDAEKIYRQTAAITSFTGQTWTIAAAGGAYSFTAPLVDTAGTVTLSNAVPRQYSTTIGDGSATSFVLTHNLNTRLIDVVVREAATPWARVYPDDAATTVNTVTVSGFTTAPTASQYTVLVIGQG